MPATGVYLVSPRSMAAIAAFLILSGVSKSGSPTDSEMISRPKAFRSRAFCVTAMVAEGLTRERASEMKAIRRESFTGREFSAAHHKDEGRSGQPERRLALSRRRGVPSPARGRRWSRSDRMRRRRRRGSNEVYALLASHAPLTWLILVSIYGRYHLLKEARHDRRPAEIHRQTVHARPQPGRAPPQGIPPAGQRGARQQDRRQGHTGADGKAALRRRSLLGEARRPGRQRLPARRSAGGPAVETRSPEVLRRMICLDTNVVIGVINRRNPILRARLGEQIRI